MFRIVAMMKKVTKAVVDIGLLYYCVSYWQIACCFGISRYEKLVRRWNFVGLPFSEVFVDC